MNQDQFDAYLSEMPLIAILRGVTPEAVAGVGTILRRHGFRIIEVPLNSPDPLRSIEILAQEFAGEAMIGAGTVLDEADVGRIKDAGGGLIISPNCNPSVIAAAKQHEMISVPGVATPSEAFVALRSGADAIKAFPAEAIPPVVLKAWMAILPKGTRVMPVGGISPETMQPYFDVGAAGFGLGSALFKPGLDVEAIGDRAAAFQAAWQKSQFLHA